MLQAVVVTLVAAAIGAALAVPRPGSCRPAPSPTRCSRPGVISSVVFLLVAAVVGCAFSLRRVLRSRPGLSHRERIVTADQHPDRPRPTPCPRCAWRRCARSTSSATRRSSRSTTPPSRSAATRSSPCVGPSGSGKTTLCSIAGGILSPTEGDGRRRRRGHHRLLAEAAHRRSAATRRLRVPGRQPRAVPHRAREPARGRRDRAPHAAPPAAPGAPTSCSRSSAWPTAPGTCRRSSRVASANGSRSAGR